MSSLRKIGRQEVEEIVQNAESKGSVVGVRLNVQEEDELTPWKMRPSRKGINIPLEQVPKSIELVVGNQIYIPKIMLTPALRNRLIRLAAFQNPEFYKQQAMRLSTYGKPRIISCAEDFPDHIGIPRGCYEEVLQLLSELKIKPIVREEVNCGQPLDVSFCGELRSDQKAAAEAMLGHDMGVLSATTAFGKTVLASWLIAKRQVNTLVLVHRKQLQEQWVERLSSFLNISPKDIGRIGGGRRKAKGLVDVALIQSLVRKGTVDDIVEQYGNLIVDECHHLPARSFEEVTRQVKTKYITGLSATITRKDGHHPIIFMQCGPVRYCVNAKDQAEARPFEHTVLVRPTGFQQVRQANEDLRVQFQNLYDELIADVQRNRLICEDVIKAVESGRSPVVLTERNEHLDDLAEQLGPHIPHLVVLRGGMTTKKIVQTTERLAAIPENEGRVLLATGKYIGEGFDDARLDTLFLTLPISWRGTIAQYVGRLHRYHHRKKDVKVYDYVDLNVPMLEKMFNKRCRGYEAVGYKILLPASASPGWPVNAPLPVDPKWKSDYAGTVQRLIRDGVDERGQSSNSNLKEQSNWN